MSAFIHVQGDVLQTCTVVWIVQPFCIRTVLWGMLRSDHETNRSYGHFVAHPHDVLL